MIKKTLFWLILLGLVGCSSQPNITHLPIIQQESLSFKVERIEQGSVQQTSLLTVQFLPNQWRFVQTEPLGSPLARLLLTQQGWQNDGFVMPNKQAQRLFLALASEFKPNNNWLKGVKITISNGQKQYQSQHNTLWQTQPQANGYHIVLADGSEWQIDKLH